ncbi:MAG: DUF6531 domain-containing protein [Solirubrobacterales bacterium]
MRRLALLLGLLVLLVLPASASAAECTDTWVGPGEGAWSAAANWSAGVPTSASIVCVGVGSTVNVTSGANEGGILQVEGSLAISGGSLVVSEVPSTVANLKILGGTLASPGEIFVSGTFIADGGVMEGAGTTVLGPEATGKVESGGGLMIRQRKLLVEGSLTVEGPEGRITGEEGGSIENLGTLVVNGEGEGNGLVAGTGAVPTLVNRGTLTKTKTEEPPLETQPATEIGFEIDNEATVYAERGILEFTGGGSSGQEYEEAWKAWVPNWGKELNPPVTKVVFAKGTYGLGAKTAVSGFVELKEGAVANGEAVEGGEGAELAVVGGSLNLTGAPSLHAGYLYLMEEGSVSAAANAEVVLTQIFTEKGSLAFGSGTKLEVSETFQEAGSLSVGSGSVASFGETFFTGGSIEVGNAVEASFQDYFQEKEPEALRVGEGSLLTASEMFLHAGDVEIGNLSTVALKAGFQENDGHAVTMGTGATLAVSEEYFASGGSLEVGAGGAITAPNFFIDPSAAADLAAGATLSTEKAFLSGGEVTGAGTLRAAELDWFNTKMTGTGLTEVTEAGLIDNGESCGAFCSPVPSYAQLDGRRMVTHGFFDIGKSTLAMGNGAVLENYGEFSASSEDKSHGAPVQILEGSTTDPKIVNHKEFNKESGPGETEVTVPFKNLGTIHQFEGKLGIKRKIAVPDSEKFGKHCNCAEPVDTATGNFSESQTDLAIGGRGVGLNLTRTYSAQEAVAATSPGPFGYGWSGTFTAHLMIEEGGAKVTLTREKAARPPSRGSAAQPMPRQPGRRKPSAAAPKPATPSPPRTRRSTSSPARGSCRASPTATATKRPSPTNPGA